MTRQQLKRFTFKQVFAAISEQFPDEPRKRRRVMAWAKARREWRAAK